MPSAPTGSASVVSAPDVRVADWRGGDEEAQGRANARSGNETKRYLPKRAWEQLSESEQRETDTKKRKASRRGQQFVANTEPAQSARRSATKLPIEGYEDLNVREITGRLAELSTAELKRLRGYESDHKGRKSVLQAIGRRL